MKNQISNKSNANLRLSNNSHQRGRAEEKPTKNWNGIPQSVSMEKVCSLKLEPKGIKTAGTHNGTPERKDFNLTMTNQSL